MRHRSSINDDVHVGRFGEAHRPLLADLVESMAGWDIASPDPAQALTLKGFPGTALLLLIHYRTLVVATRQFGSRDCRPPHCRRVVIKRQTGVVVARRTPQRFRRSGHVVWRIK
jgi:hypothetical protein